ncbi:MAG TPA: hypothetical protein VF812_10575 [Ktedonobacterales bacterium]
MSTLARQRTIFLWLTLIVVGANYLAQIPYYLHLYYFPHGALPNARGSLLLGLTLVWFLAGYSELARGRALGYWLLLTFLLTEVVFYAHGIYIRVTNGFPALEDMQTHDLLLQIVFGIGYLNMVAGAFFLLYLLRHHRALVTRAGVAL